MQADISDGQSSPKRRTAEKTAILQRLARIEGQVRGLRVMVEQNRELAEQIQQMNAVVAALREVALLSISQEIKGRLSDMVEAPGEARDLGGLVDLLRATFRLT